MQQTSSIYAPINFLPAIKNAYDSITDFIDPEAPRVECAHLALDLKFLRIDISLRKKVKDPSKVDKDKIITNKVIDCTSYKEL